MSMPRKSLNEIISEYHYVKSSNALFRQRVYANFMYYASLQDCDVLRSKWLKELEKQNIDTKVFNFIQMLIEGHAGNLLNYTISPKWSSNVYDDSQIETLLKSWYDDYDNFKFDSVNRESVKNLLVIRAVEEMVIVRSTKNPQGDIKLVSVFPNEIDFDPSVKVADVGLNSKFCFRDLRLSPNVVMDMFPQKNNVARIERYDREVQATYENDSMREALANQEQIYMNDKIKLVEHYEIRVIREKVDFDRDNKVEIPQTEFKYDSNEDILAKKIWASKKGLKLSNNIHTSVRNTEKMFVRTFSPELNHEFQYKLDERQIVDKSGSCRLPFFTCSFQNVAGKDLGIPDLTISSQDDFNLRELSKSKQLAKGFKGKTVYSPLLHGNDPQKKQELEDNFNDDSVPYEASGKVPPGMIDSMIRNIPRTPVDPNLLQDEMWKLDFAKLAVRMPDVKMGAGGKSGDSYLLQQGQIEEAESMIGLLVKSFQDFHLGKFDAYKQIKIYLLGKGHSKSHAVANMNRTISLKNEEIVINKVVVDDFGEVGIENDFINMDPSKISTVAAKKNAYFKGVEKRASMFMLNSIPNDENSAPMRLILMKQIIENMEELSEEQKTEIENLLKLQLDLMKKNLLLQNFEAEQAIKGTVAVAQDPNSITQQQFEQDSMKMQIGAGLEQAPSQSIA
jgi:hypothetical protein